jgi:GTPase
MNRTFINSIVNFHITINEKHLSKLYKLGEGHFKVTQLS